MHRGCSEKSSSERRRMSSFQQPANISYRPHPSDAVGELIRESRDGVDPTVHPDRCLDRIGPALDERLSGTARGRAKPGHGHARSFG